MQRESQTSKSSNTKGRKERRDLPVTETHQPPVLREKLREGKLVPIKVHLRRHVATKRRELSQTSERPNLIQPRLSCNHQNFARGHLPKIRNRCRCTENHKQPRRGKIKPTAHQSRHVRDRTAREQRTSLQDVNKSGDRAQKRKTNTVTDGCADV